jgi:DNA-damage-inducible protein D
VKHQRKDTPIMSQELVENGDHKATMQRLEYIRHEDSRGKEYWLAREIQEVLGYPVWAKFEPVIDRARNAFLTNSVDPSHQIVPTDKLMGVGKGAQYKGSDYFLTRAACYLIAMNGDPSKPEVGAAQAYFAVKTRQAELAESKSDDEKRLELREKVSVSFRKVSGVAQEAGVPGKMQGVFHDARYKGLYGRSGKEVKALKNLPPDANLFDFAAPLELSAHDFQMNLAADVITRERIKGSQQAIRKNEEVAQRVRKAMTDSGAPLPENLPLAEPIKDVKKRIAAQKKQLGKSSNSSPTG